MSFLEKENCMLLQGLPGLFGKSFFHTVVKALSTLICFDFEMNLKRGEKVGFIFESESKFVRFVVRTVRKRIPFTFLAVKNLTLALFCLLYTSPSPRDS